MKMPIQKPYRSVQEVGTPREFLDAVEDRYGYIRFDLAANYDNAVCDMFYGEDDENGSLDRDWHELDGLLWLNPPYANIEPWAKKCSESTGRIALLVPASVGSNWFRNYVAGKAYICFLSPRLTFVGHAAPYPKDCLLALYGYIPGYECWRWK